MSYGQAIKIALKNIYGNKFRSFLTMLGIIIGVAAVIALVSIGQGATKNVTDQIQGLGSNLISVNIIGRGSQTTLKYDEAMKFANLSDVTGVSPVITGNVTAKNGVKSVDVNLEGTNPDYENIRQTHVRSGRFIMPLDLENRNKVALLGSNTAAELFGFADPIGQSIQINGIRFKVVGVLEQKGSSLGGSNDDKIIIPISTAERLLASPGVRTIYVEADSPDHVQRAMWRIEGELAKKFKGNEDSYNVFSQQDMLQTVSSVSSTMTLMLGGIAGISLLVGGIGIMNIMLVSVTERTREIGIRKAIGAKKRDILLQFLIEAIVLSLIGGLIGVGIGVGIALLLSNVFRMTVALSLQVILIALGFSVGVGVLFGILPANRAAKLNPIDALRFE
ncbi:MAG: ABC transporter permease [Thermicanus sp.]|nr:ABC transporter permease [Thermicanus sp.]